MEPDKNDLDLIKRYLQGALAPDEIDGVQIRLKHDREFARKVRYMQTFPTAQEDNSVKSSPEPSLQDFSWEFDLKKRVHLSWPSIMVITLLVIVFGITLFFLTSPTPFEETIHSLFSINESTEPVNNHPPELLPTDSAGVAPMQQKKDTAVLKPVEVKPVEVKPTIVQNSSSSYTLKTPEDGAIIPRGSEIHFTWQQLPDSITHIYILSAPSQKVIWWRAVRTGVREFRVPASHFHPGTYQWYVGLKKSMRSFTVAQ